MAQIRTQTKQVLDTFEDFVLKIISVLPKGYTQVDLVAWLQIHTENIVLKAVKDLNEAVQIRSL